MIPQGGQRVTAVTQQPSRTYRLDPAAGRIIGHADGLEAVKQAAYKILQTIRFEHSIYNGNYGAEIESVTGQGPAHARSELGRLIRTALLQDDRIKDVQDMVITITGDEALATFTVVTAIGNFELTKEV